MTGMTSAVLALLLLTQSCLSHDANRVVDIAAWDFDYSFSGIETFAHLPHVKCLTHPDEAFDIAVIGAPL